MDLKKLEKVDRFDKNLDWSAHRLLDRYVLVQHYDQALSLIRSQQELLRAYRDTHYHGIMSGCETCKAADALLPPIEEK
jgi:hypothetical protein